MSFLKKKKSTRNLEILKEDILSKVKKETDILKIELEHEKQAKEIKKVSPELQILKAAIKGEEIKQPDSLRLNAYVTTENPIYHKYKNLVEFWLPIVEKIYEKTFKFIDLRRLALDLYATKMKFTPTDYIAFVSAISLTIGCFGLIIGLIMYLIGMIGNLLFAILGPIALMMIILVFGLKYPSLKNKSRASNIEQNLLFALREMSCLLSAGLGIQTAMRRIATSDYEELSEEFKLLIAEINAGLPTEDALTHMIERNYSPGLYKFATMVIRTMKTGGEMGKILRMLADEIARDQMFKIQKFTATLNLLAIFFLFGATVAPVMFGILSAIQSLGLMNIAGSALTTGGRISTSQTTDPTALIFIYCFGFPMVLVSMLMMIKALEPKV